MHKPPRGIARFDSAAAMVLALSSSLRGEPFTSPSQSPLLDRLLPTLNHLPRHLREWCYSIGGMGEGITLRKTRHLDTQGIAYWMTQQYPSRQYKAAFIGSSNGAMVHLAAAMGVPWLPQTFLCPVRSFGNDPDDAQKGFRDGQPIVDALMSASPHIAVHHMQDPNQDRLMLNEMSYFRLKYRALPLAYLEFLLRNLAPGATLFINNCTRQWPVTRTSPRSVFQFGATGGASEEEYHKGGPRVAACLAHYGIDRQKWDPPAPNDSVPEAEWGFDVALTDNLRQLAREMNWRLVELRYCEPESLSFVAAAAWCDWYQDAGIQATRLVVDSFLLMDPMTTMRLHALPFWLVFCTEPSAAMLERFLDLNPSFKHIDLMLFSHGTESIGLASVARWQSLLARATQHGEFAGVDTTRYPRDFATLVRYHTALAHRGKQQPLPAAMTLEQFEATLRRYGAEHDVSWLE